MFEISSSDNFPIRIFRHHFYQGQYYTCIFSFKNKDGNSQIFDDLSANNKLLIT